jgi:hypothetical protein
MFRPRRGQELEEWIRSDAYFPVEPLPLDFRAAVEDVLEVAADPGHMGYRTPGAQRYDHRGVLLAITPDLRNLPPIGLHRVNGTTEVRRSGSEQPARRPRR